MLRLLGRTPRGAGLLRRAAFRFGAEEDGDEARLAKKRKDFSDLSFVG